MFIQRSSHPQFSIQPGDTIIYYSKQGIQCNQVQSIQQESAFTSYTLQTTQTKEQPIYPADIIGKVISTLDKNPWNDLSITIWEASVSSLNIRALFAD